MNRTFTFTWVDWKSRKKLAKRHPKIVKYAWMPTFEWNHIRPHGGQDPQYDHEYRLWIFWGWHGIVLESEVPIETYTNHENL